MDMDMEDRVNGEMVKWTMVKVEKKENSKYKGPSRSKMCGQTFYKNREVKVYRRPRTEPSGRTAPTNARSSMQRII